MISVVCFLWNTPAGKKFSPVHVNALARMVAKHYRHAYRFICVTNAADGFDQGIELVADKQEWAKLPSPHGPGWPSCYRRLTLFATDAGKIFGDRFVALDLDAVLTNDVTWLWTRPEDFVIWRDPGRRTPYCGSMFMLTAGARPHVYTTFDPATSPQAAVRAGYLGSDQAWIALALGPYEATWNHADGVISYRMDLEAGKLPLPRNARVVFFHGKHKPWDAGPAALPWVRANWGCIDATAAAQ